MVSRNRIPTLDEFLVDDSIAGPESPLSPREVAVTVRTVSGEVVLGPESLRQGMLAASLTARLAQPDSLVRLLHGESELADLDPILDKSGTGFLELTVVYTIEPSEEQRRKWIDQLDDGDSLAILPAVAQGDRKVVLAAIGRRADEMRHATPEIRRDRVFMADAARRQGEVLRFADVELRCDAEVMMAALEFGHASLRHADRSLLSNKEFMLAAVSFDGLALRYADSTLRSDRQVVLAAIEQDEDALQYAECDDAKVQKLRERQLAQHQAMGPCGILNGSLNDVRNQRFKATCGRC